MADPDVPLAGQALDIAGQIVKTQRAIVRQQGKSRRSQRWLALSIVLDVFLTAAIFWSSHQACVQGNQFRAGQVQLWDHVLAVSKAPPGETPSARAQRLATLAAFRAYIARRFAPAGCTIP